MIVGLSTILGVLAKPGLQVYVDPPLAVNVIEPDEHNTVEEGEIETVGAVFKFIVIVLVAIHPLPLSPETV